MTAEFDRMREVAQIRSIIRGAQEQLEQLNRDFPDERKKPTDQRNVEYTSRRIGIIQIKEVQVRRIRGY